MTIEDAITAEKAYFENDPVWQNVDPSLVGVEALKDKLVSLLEAVIMNGLSGVIDEINNELSRKNESLEMLGGSLETSAERRTVFASAVDQYTRLLQSALTGKYSDPFFKMINEPVEEGEVDQTRDQNGHLKNGMSYNLIINSKTIVFEQNFAWKTASFRMKS